MSRTTRTSVELLIVFIDLARFRVETLRRTDVEIADGLDEFFEQVAATVEAAQGTVVKFMGDAALIVFPRTAVDVGIGALMTLKGDIDGMMVRRGWECRLEVKVHFGTVVAGVFGARNDKRFDVIGRAVNTTAMLQTTGVTLTAEAFRKLSPELRKQFRKHTPPISYLRNEDARPVRRKA